METTEESSRHEDSSTNTPFSRASLYAPLSTIQDASRRNKPLPKSLQESALMDFLRQVSTDCHLNAAPSDAKSGRPLNASEMSVRIKSRALTLVGGGYHRAVGGKQQISEKRGGRRKRKRAETEWSSLLENQELREKQINFLKELNELWNEYARNMLGITENTTLDDTLRSKIFASSSSMEWAGSLACIESCKQHPAWIGRQGILVELTSNTWRLIEYDVDHELDTRGKAKDDNASSTQTMRAIVVPKYGSSLSVFLPSTGETTSNTSSKQGIRIVLRDSRDDIS